MLRTFNWETLLCQDVKSEEGEDIVGYGLIFGQILSFIDRFLHIIESPHYFLSLVTVSAFETCVLRLNVIQPTDHHIHRPSKKRSGS